MKEIRKSALEKFGIDLYEHFDDIFLNRLKDSEELQEKVNELLSRKREVLPDIGLNKT